jgi:hypothetical protein
VKVGVEELAHDCTAELFDAWFDIDVHSMVWDLVAVQVEE